MKLSENSDLIIGALFRNGGELYGVVKEALDAHIDFVNRQSSSEGDLFKDIPKFYAKEGALQQLKMIRSVLIDIEKEFKRRQDK